MPPKMAMRFMSGVPLPARRIGAEGAVLPARVTRLMRDGERPLCFRQCRAETGVRAFDQDRANVDAAIGDHPAVTAHEQVRIETVQHFGADALVLRITALPFALGADAQRGE